MRTVGAIIDQAGRREPTIVQLDGGSAAEVSLDLDACCGTLCHNSQRQLPPALATDPLEPTFQASLDLDIGGCSTLYDNSQNQLPRAQATDDRPHAHPRGDRPGAEAPPTPPDQHLRPTDPLELLV